MLNEYRKQLDLIDREIILLLKKRQDIIKKIGEYKKKNNINAYQPARWKEVLETRKQFAKENQIDPKFVEKLWELIHEWSLKLQKL